MATTTHASLDQVLSHLETQQSLKEFPAGQAPSNINGIYVVTIVPEIPFTVFLNDTPYTVRGSLVLSHPNPMSLLHIAGAELSYLAPASAPFPSSEAEQLALYFRKGSFSATAVETLESSTAFGKITNLGLGTVTIVAPRYRDPEKVIVDGKLYPNIGVVTAADLTGRAVLYKNK